MSGVSYFPGRQGVQTDMPDERQHRRDMARTMNLLMQGHNNSTLQLTLTPGAATTTITDVRISLQTAPLAAPMTANAAAEIGNGTMWFVVSQGQCVVHHANSAVADRIFNVALIG